MNRKRKNHKRLGTLPFVVLPVSFFLFIGLKSYFESVEAEAHITPEYPKENIEPIIWEIESEKDMQDYDLLFQQTGLGKAAVDFLIANDRQQELMDLQEKFFADITVECEANTIITREEQLAGNSVHPFIPYVENGDILISFNCHAFGWRNGHAAMVVNADERLTLEARILGTDSAIISMDHWENYPSFAVLRLKNATKEQREEIAAYAAENLINIPYLLEAGIFDFVETPESDSEMSGMQSIPSGTHCAHLVWYAYQGFGYDLDSDGGMIVTPRDLYESPYLEIVQVYGMQIPDR